ncbi:MAG: 2-oxoacid:ferredoxin oxidoreductase subunit beta [Deltaproteobacteria bacterium]|jgi:2-oxoglutarate ferredoxin oxidoreductase subunit beta|nr:2-oxoacid:ferredoxin oxidoreductase subunit beta [Deltaproteobacteria bacterium]
MAIRDYIRERFFPHIWCPGCGHGMVLNGLLRAIEKIGLDKNEIVMVSGIGCSARIAGYVDFHTMHTIHGRALAFATGIKMSRPELKLIVPMGDGDALAIGGNHFIHAARRNMDMTAIVMNNRVYGMTGGQYSPLSGYGTMSTTSPYSNIDHAFDVVELSVAAGASFVGRTTTYHAKQMADILGQAIIHKGFSVVEIMSQCPTCFGRQNRLGSAIDMLEHFKENTTPIGSKAKQKNPDLIERGIFVQKKMPEYCSEYEKIIERAMVTVHHRDRRGHREYN